MRLVKRLSLAAGLLVLAVPAAVRAEEPADGPRSLLITYRADPARRPAFAHYLAHDEWARLAQWKKDGVISGFQILFNPFNTEDTWDAMLVLRFTRFTDTAKWMAIERSSPGGLAPEGLALAKPVNSYSADADWEDGDDDSAKDAGAIFYVIPYEYRNEAEYRSYVDGYVLPQVKGWMKAGVLTGYRIFMNRYPVGKPWDALFVYRYRDLDAFGKREAIIAQVRTGLQPDPVWSKWNANKSGIRTESENVVAQAIRPE